MNDLPRLRSALSSLADGGTAADPGAVAARAATIRRRRFAATGAGAVSLAVVLGAAVAAFSTSPREGGFAAEVSQTPEATLSAEPTPELTPTPSTTPVATTAAPTPTVEPTTASPSPAPSGTFAPPGARITVSVPDGATTGRKVTITVRVTDTDGSWNGAVVEFGDGAKDYVPHHTPGCLPYTGPVDYTARPSDTTKTFLHVYRTAGTFVVRVTARSTTNPCRPSGPDEQVTGSARLEVGGEDLASNGPAAPVLTLERTGGTGTTAEVTMTYRDPDGQLWELVLDWGDGGTPVTRPMRYGCENSPDTGYPEGEGDGAEVHEYAAAGTYTVTVTFRSAGCDGKEIQEATETIDVTVS